MNARTRRVVAVALVQLVLVGAAVWAPLSARLTGEEVRLRVVSVDPVDPFRGAYVDLAYIDLPEQPADLQSSDPTSEGSGRGTAFVALTPTDAIWVGGPVLRQPPAEGTFLRCDDSDGRLRCGIESLWLPQDEAAATSTMFRAGASLVVVRVDSRGHAALIGLATDR